MTLSRSLRLIAVPAVISLAVTLLRLTGELRHWPERWFSTGTGGPVPQGLNWIVGITWLAIPFGIYFAFKLISTADGPPSMRRALTCAASGVAVFIASMYALRLVPVKFPQVLILIWLSWSAAAAVQFLGWPSLSKLLLWYGFAARIPVAIVMFFAMLGNWGTHYDYVGIQWPSDFPPGFVSRYLWLALFPQLVAWIAYTVTLGSLAGSVTAALLTRKR